MAKNSPLHLTIVQSVLTDPRVDPSAKNNIAIIWASTNGHLAIVQFLLADARVDPCVRNNEALNFAIKYGRLKIVKVLRNSPCIMDDIASRALALK